VIQRLGQLSTTTDRSITDRLRTKLYASSNKGIAGTPLEPVTLLEGTEVEVVIPDRRKDFARFEASFGGWSGLLDFEAFEEGRRESRIRSDAPRLRYLVLTTAPRAMLACPRLSVRWCRRRRGRAVIRKS
jgi:hypothetical protein